MGESIPRSQTTEMTHFTKTIAERSTVRYAQYCILDIIQSTTVVLEQQSIQVTKFNRRIEVELNHSPNRIEQLIT